MMKHILLITLLSLAATTAQAGCYADYKAKQDDPLRLHYGVAQLSEDVCTKQGAKAALKSRLAREGWTLLNIVSIFGDEGLAERKASAGQYFLRY